MEKEKIQPSKEAQKTENGEEKIAVAPEQERDKEVDTAKACEVAREWTRDYIGNLSRHDFRIERVEENGNKTKYIVIVSIVPDIGQEREYYVIRVDVITGKIISPIGKGKKTLDGKLDLEPLEVEKEWIE